MQTPPRSIRLKLITRFAEEVISWARGRANESRTCVCPIWHVASYIINKQYYTADVSGSGAAACW